MDTSELLLWLFVLPIAVASISWTVTHEELFFEFRQFCRKRSLSHQHCWLVRKFFYGFTCEYCFSHWVGIALVAVTGYRLLLPGVIGAAIAVLACVFIANIYMNLYGTTRVALRWLRSRTDEPRQHAASAGGMLINN